MPRHRRQPEERPTGTDTSCPPIYCGPEGWLTGQEFIERTKRDVEAYAREQPYRYATAMMPRDSKGRRVFSKFF